MNDCLAEGKNRYLYIGACLMFMYVSLLSEISCRYDSEKDVLIPDISQVSCSVCTS